MIYTLTFNPSIDYVVKVDDISYADVNRAQEEYILPGGKGINVSLVLHTLGIESHTLGFIAGFTGAQIEAMLQKAGLHTDFIKIGDGMSRINVKIKSTQEGEINGIGPHISPKDLDSLYAQLQRLNSHDYLVLGGNVQSCVSKDIYRELAEYANRHGVRCIIDASGPLLANALVAKPFLVKPNKVELEGICQRSLDTIADVVAAAKELQSNGALNVLVSLAADGAILVTEQDTVYYANAPAGEVINSVGAGDSMVAGFLAGLQENERFETALRMGICAGSASAFSKSLATKDDIYRLTELVKVTCI